MAQVIKSIIIGTSRKAEFFRHLLSGSEHFEFVGFYDPDDPENSDALGNLIYTLELCDKADAFIFDRHIGYFDPAFLQTLTRMGKHLLFDGFPLADTNLIGELHKLQNEARNIIQIGNVLHNKPLYTAAAQFIRKPRLIRLEKNCNAPKPGEFQSWFFKNLAQDLDIILRLAGSGIRNIAARPMFLFGKSPDLLNIHIEFDNDAICHISAGRAVDSGTHKFRIFQQDRFFHLDFSDNLLNEFRPPNESDQLTILPNKEIFDFHEFTEIPRAVMPFDTWKMEIRNFAENIQKHLTPFTNLTHLENTAKASQDIVEKVQRRYQEV